LEKAAGRRAAAASATIWNVTTRLLPHTADLWLEVEAHTLRALFEEFASSLVSFMVEGPVEPREHREVELAADNREALLVRFLNEVNFLLEQEGFLTGAVRFQSLGSKRMKAWLLGEPCQGGRQRLVRSVKAATYHQLSLDRTSRGWRGQVIFDL
jgi:SHS2 domain-containing protein